jgi:hypothetical protein
MTAQATRRDRVPMVGLVGLLGGLPLLLCLGFPLPAASAREPLLLRPVVRARFQLIGLTSIAVEVKDFLRVAAAHTRSLARWQRAEKRTTMPQRGISPQGRPYVPPLESSRPSV